MASVYIDNKVSTVSIYLIVCVRVLWLIFHLGLCINGYKVMENQWGVENQVGSNKQITRLIKIMVNLSELELLEIISLWKDFSP